MAEPEPKPIFSFKVLTVASDYLEFEIKNISGQLLSGALDIETQFPSDQVHADIRNAIQGALVSTSPPNMKSLAGIVTSGVDLSVWALKEETPKIAAIRALNYLDQGTGKNLTAPAKVAVDAVFKMRVPLTPQSKPAQVTVSYKYKHGGRKDPWINGSLEFTTAGGVQWEPKVSLTLDQPNSTMLEPAQKIRISWAVTDGVSATLRGPLPGGHSQLTLSKDSKSDHRMDQGFLETYATGPATYMLDAEVRRPQGGPNVQVIRMLLIDTKSVDKYASLRVRPSRVLANGQVDIDWTVWGIDSLKLRIEPKNKDRNQSTPGGARSVTLELTEQDAFHTYHGTGVWTQRARDYDEEVFLAVNDNDELKQTINVAYWERTIRPTYKGTPLGLAVAAPHMALLTSDGLWIAEIGRDDNTSSSPKFRKVTPDTPARAWRALTAFKQGFVVMSETPQKGLLLMRYSSEGTQQGAATDVPSNYVESLISHPGATYELTASSECVYLVLEVFLPGGSAREVYSVRFEPSEEIRHEPLLAQLHDYQLLAFAGGLYGLHRGSGQMLRFDLSTDRDIEEAWKAANAANKSGQSFVRTGLRVPVDNLLVVLDPGDISSPKPLSLSNQVNVSDFDLTSDKDTDVLQDLIYNPQRDEWTACGQGLKIKPGAVAAFRDGISKRLWVLQPDGDMYTLVDANAKLFAPKYVNKFPPAVLPPALNAQRVFPIRNESGLNLIPMNFGPTWLGFDEVNSDGLVDVDPAPRMKLTIGRREFFQIRYHKTNPPPVTMRFLANPDVVGATADSPSYVLEVTFGGPDLTSVTSVFKHIASDQARVVSITPVLGSLVQYPADRPALENVALRSFRNEPSNRNKPDPERPVVIPPPQRLTERNAKVIICNASPYPIQESHKRASNNSTSETRVDYLTPSFTIHALPADNYRRFGELRFDINFALPHGLETSSGSMTQQSLFRINSDKSTGLEVKLARMLKPGDPAIDVGYRFQDEDRKLRVEATEGVVYVVQITSPK